MSQKDSSNQSGEKNTEWVRRLSFIQRDRKWGHSPRAGMRGRRSEFCLLEQMATESGSQEQTKGIINKTHESECPRSAPLAPSNPSTLRQPLYKQDFLSHKGPLWACVHRGGVDAFPVHRKQFQRPCPKERSDKADASRSCSSALEVTVTEWKIRKQQRKDNAIAHDQARSLKLVSLILHKTISSGGLIISGKILLRLKAMFT